MFVCVVCCQVEVSVMIRSLVQRSPSDCGTSVCVWSRNLVWQGGHGTRWAAEPEKIIIIIIIDFVLISERWHRICIYYSPHWLDFYSLLCCPAFSKWLIVWSRFYHQPF
jgi:hypothetical protein